MALPLTAPSMFVPSLLQGQRRRGAVPLVLLVATLGGCSATELTDPPNWDVAFNFPVKGTSISVGSLLPAGVTIRQDSGAFMVAVPGVSIQRTLGAVCPECAPINGLTAPRPAFAFSATTTAALPADVATATLAGGSLAVTILNGYGFDPLGGSGAGAMVITVTDAGNRLLARDSVNGATLSMPAGGVATRTLTLAPGPVRGPLTVAATVTSPQGAPVVINTAQALTILGTLQDVAVSDASVTVAAKAINTSASTFDLSGIDATIRDRLLGGALRLSVANPFGVTGALSLTLAGGGVTVTKPLALAAGTSTPSIAFSQQELTSMAGKNLALTLTGPVSASAAVRVTPRDRVTVGARLEITMSTEAK